MADESSLIEAAQVALENASLQYDKLYSYRIPEGMVAQPGCRVTVPFGAGNRTRQGLVMAIEQREPNARLKPLAGLIDPAPLLNAELLELVRYLREYTFCSYFDAVRTLLPPGLGVALKYVYLLEQGAKLPGDADADMTRIFEYLRGRGKPAREETMCAALGLEPTCPALMRLCVAGVIVKSQEVRQRILDEKLVMVRPADGVEELADVADKLSAKQQTALALLLEAGQASLKELCYFAAVGKPVIDRLEKAGAVCYFTREVYRNPYEGVAAKAGTQEIVLSDEQQTAFDTLCGLINAGEAATALLYGVTGSGKTEVFLRTIRHVLDSGRGAIVMVPEIALTPQTIARFHRYFGQGVAVLHSGLSMSERMDEWKRIRDGNARIVVGTRSAVFAPMENIGLIILDEEQESSYKSEKSPRYHARDVALVRAARQKAVTLLASATPGIESFYRAKQGQYHLLTLKKRFGTAKLPDVTILDMSAQPLTTGSASVSEGLLYELRYNLEHKQQSILLLNRRGYNTLVKCAVCGVVASCPNCSVALTYHSANKHMMCHYCGHTASADALCPTCGSRFRRFSGAGTQKVEEELRILMPDARILRMDMDTTMSRFSHEKHFTAFSEGKYDIMIGTQMVAKGLDFPAVTLVGILSADSALYAQDYRSFERAFALFTQVVGRAGRADKAGRAYVQTFTPENPVIEMAARQDYAAFYAEEIENRQIHLYPPFCDMAGIGFAGLEAARVRDGARSFVARLAELAKTGYSDLPLRILGPCESPIARVAGKFRWRMAVKCRYHTRTRALLREALMAFYACPESKGVSVSIDPKYENSI